MNADERKKEICIKKEKVKPSAPVELYFLWSNASAAAAVAIVVGEYAFMIVVVSSASFVSFENGEIFKMVWIIYGPAKSWGKKTTSHTQRENRRKNKMFEKTRKKSGEHTLMRKSRVLCDEWASIISAPIHCYNNWLIVIWNAKLNKRPLNAQFYFFSSDVSWKKFEWNCMQNLLRIVRPLCFDSSQMSDRLAKLVCPVSIPRLSLKFNFQIQW